MKLPSLFSRFSWNYGDTGFEKKGRFLGYFERMSGKTVIRPLSSLSLVSELVKDDGLNLV